MTPAHALARCADIEGSTRAISLVRIGLALVIWARFAHDMALHSNTDGWHVFVSIWFFVFTSMMLVGLYTRLAVPMVALTLAVLYFVFGLGGVRSEWAAHHIYLLMAVTTLLSFTPCERSYSVDRYRAVLLANREGRSPPAEYGNLWAQRLIIMQMAALYFWTAVDKSGAPFLSGDRLEAILTWLHSGRPLEEILLLPAFLVPASVAIVLVEYFLAVGILVRWLLPIAVPLGLALHASFYVMLPLATYSITMIVLYLAVLPPDSVHRVIDRMQGHAPTPHRL